MSVGDRLRDSMQKIIGDAVRKVEFLRLVRARVVHVLAGGAVDTEPETLGTPQFPALPLRYGVPGVLRGVAKTGARVLVAFAEGDPKQPYVAAWDPCELEELVFDVSGGAEALARTDDEVDSGSIVISTTPRPDTTPTSTDLVFRYTDGTGSVTTITVNGLPSGVTVSGGTGTFNLLGIITGTSRIKA